MSEGRYPRMPKPKDKSHRSLEIGEVTLETRDDRKRREYAEETGDEMPAKRERKATPESMLAKVARVAGEFGASVSKPWSKLTGEKDEDEE